MSKELVISTAPHETRVAILEEGQLCEIYIEREKEFALVGSIYKGRVTRVLPGMQSAFVDIGLDGDAFLYVSDVFENLEEYDHVSPVEPRAERAEDEPGCEREGGRKRQEVVDVRAYLAAGERRRERAGDVGEDERRGAAGGSPPHRQGHGAGKEDGDDGREPLPLLRIQHGVEHLVQMVGPHALDGLAPGDQPLLLHVHRDPQGRLARPLPAAGLEHEEAPLHHG